MGLRITRRRRGLLAAIDRGQINKHSGGYYWHWPDNGWVTGVVRPLVEAGLAEARPGGSVRLTAHGRLTLQQQTRSLAERGGVR